MSIRAVIGVDCGGSSSKATLLDENGKIVATSTDGYPSLYPHSGWIEQDTNDIWNSFIKNVRFLVQISQNEGYSIVGLAVDAATHMAVLCDKDDKPIRPVIYWSDSRSSDYAEELKRVNSDLVKKYSVNSPSAAWTLPQLLWIKENEPETLKKTKKIYFLKDYIRSRVTGDFYTDLIEAMGAMLADDYTETWCKDYCDLVGINVDCLPEIKKPSDVAGTVSKEFSALSGMPEGIPVIVGTTDTVLEVFAAGAVRQGDATVKLATAGRICPVMDRPIPSYQFFNYKHLIPGLWYPGSGTKTCAASLDWFARAFKGTESAQNDYINIILQEAEKISPGSEGIIFHPFLLGEMTPYYDNKLRAGFNGVGIQHTRAHFIRSVLEGVAFSMRDCLNEIRKYNVEFENVKLIGGGARSPLWRQILADILGMKLQYVAGTDSSLGSAMLAGFSVGLFKDLYSAVSIFDRNPIIIEPLSENVEIYNKCFENYKIVQRAMSVAYHSIEEL